VLFIVFMNLVLTTAAQGEFEWIGVSIVAVVLWFITAGARRWWPENFRVLGLVPGLLTLTVVYFVAFAVPVLIINLFNSEWFNRPLAFLTVAPLFGVLVGLGMSITVISERHWKERKTSFVPQPNNSPLSYRG